MPFTFSHTSLPGVTIVDPRVFTDPERFDVTRSPNDHITFGFWRGTELDDPDFRLEGEGDRMKHLKIHSAGEVSEGSLGDWIRQAVDLNRRLGNPTAKGEAIETRSEPPIQLIVPVTPVEEVGPGALPTNANDDGWQDEFQP